MYMRGQENGPISTFWIPYENEDQDSTNLSDDGGKPFRYWAAICYNGAVTDKIYAVNLLSNTKPTIDICKKYY